MHFATMANWLQGAKLNYACSAHYLDAVDNINLSKDQQALIKDIPDVTFAETVRDFMVNQQFRRDYWIKGVRKLNRMEQSEQLGALRILLNVPRDEVSLKANGTLGQADMTAQIYNPILDCLADHKPRTLAEIAESVKSQGVTHAQVIEAMLVLGGTGQAGTAQDSAIVAKCKKKTDKLNRHLMRKARSAADINVLASPVTGGGFNIGRFQQLFALAYSEGQKDTSDWANYTWNILSGQGQRIVRDGKPLESAEDNLAELNAQAASFKTKLLPILRALEIV